MRRTLLFIGLAILAAPIALVLAFLLVPLWSWLESAHGIESVGHSGPAQWCYVASYAFVVIVASLIGILRRGE
jgi:hypothetical protein